VRKIIKSLLFPILKRIYAFRSSRARNYSKYGIDLVIQPSVFHPGLFLSTNIFIEFIQKFDFEGKKMLELGAGSGMISFYAAKYKKAIVTASDINPMAIAGLKKNSLQTKIPITVVSSDLFENLQASDFDFILINPPYYPKDPKNSTENAFYCGENFEYFTRLFAQLNEKAVLTENETFLILSQDCEIEKIKELAIEQKIVFKKVHKEKKLREWSYIFRLVDSSSTIIKIH
jgi:release factor glutamine methyltransferase